MNFLAKVSNSKTHRIPRTFGLAQKKVQNEINIRSFYIPEDYIEPLSTSIYLADSLVKLDLSRTQLNESSGTQIVNNLPFRLKNLTLSHNQQIGSYTIDDLCSVVLEDVRFSLQNLYLEDCSLGDECVIRIGQSLKGNDNLRLLNLSKNGITH